MNKKLIVTILCIAILPFIHTILFGDNQNIDQPAIQEHREDTTDITQKKEPTKKIISFNYDNENLVDVINYLAAEKNINIVLPMGAKAITSKLTLHIEEKMTLTEAWDFLYTILDIAGYSLIPKDDIYTVVQNSKDISREPLPIYIGIQPDQIPDTDQRIRYLYYLANIKLSDAGENELITAIREILPDTASYKVDQATNAILITDKANNIKSVMQIIITLDQTGFQEKLKIIKLHYASAGTVASLFNESILKSTVDINRYRLDTKKITEATFFSRHTKIIAEERLNALIILGRPQAVDRIEHFIHNYIDVELESGKSILHVYQLQYLDASTFEPILQKIVESTLPGGTGQARAAIQTERSFEGVIIKADKPQNNEEGSTAFGGGNKLIIAARNKDWKRIKKLIEELDKPQPQVILEVLVADLTIEDTRLLGALIRNPLNLPLPKNVDMQAAQIGPVIVDNLDNPTSIAADLLKKAFTENNQPATTEADAVKSIAGVLTAGSGILAFNDKDTGKTWGILQVLKLFDHKKVISNPHVIAVNNKQANIIIGEGRYVPDEGVGSPGGATTRKKKWIDAKLEIKITPRISSQKTVNLTVEVNIEDFVSKTLSDANRVRRNVITNANVGNGDILSLGGLLSIDTEQSVSETPILGRIPILGYLFKNRQGKTSKTNLTVFISPTIIEPKLRGGIGEYTQDYINLTKKYATEGMLFDSLKDPITRWFFAPDRDARKAVEDFSAKDKLKQGTPLENLEQGSKIVVFNNKKEHSTETLSHSNTKKSEHTLKLKELLEDEENPLLHAQQ